MAELLLKVGDKPRPSDWKDGDIIAAFNRRRIEHVHAEHICWERDPATRKFAALANLLLPDDHVSRDYCEAVYALRFERLGRDEARVVRLSDGDAIQFRSGVPFVQHDGRLAAMDVHRYVRARYAGLRSAAVSGKPMFGAAGSEVWYGGAVDLSQGATDQVWAAIEAKTPHRRTDPGRDRWPAGRLDLRHHLALVVDDFSDATAEELVAPFQPPAPQAHQRRRRHVPWRSLLGLTSDTIARIDDRSQAVDLRGAATFSRAVIVQDKANP